MAMLRRCLKEVRMRQGNWATSDGDWDEPLSESADASLLLTPPTRLSEVARSIAAPADSRTTFASDDVEWAAATALTFPCGDAPAPGHAREVAPGVSWLRMPMPGDPSHINLWAVRDGRGWAVVDTGLHTSQTSSAWRSLTRPDGPLGEGVTRVLVTHMHPDHAGMAGWLTREFDCTLWMTRSEYLNCRLLAADTGHEAPPEGVRFYRQAGWGEEAIERYRARFGSFGEKIVPLPQRYRRVQDGERVRIGEHEWLVVVGAGHSPEHACFYCAELRVLISGDQVLPQISSNVSVFPTEPEADPLADWLMSIEKLRQCIPDDVLVLPAHGEPFRGLHARLTRLAGRRNRAIERLRPLLAERPRRAIDVFKMLFARQIDAEPRLLQLATGESVAYLNYLVQRGEVTVTVDVDGVGWYGLNPTAN